jgi:hypothetical protein
MSLSQDSPSSGWPSIGSGMPYAQLMASAQLGSPCELPAELDGCPLHLASCLVDVQPLAQSLTPSLAGPQPLPFPSCSSLDQSQVQPLRLSTSPHIHSSFPTPPDGQDHAQPLHSLQSQPYPTSTSSQLQPSSPCAPLTKHPDAICYHPVTQEVLFIPLHLHSPSQVLESIGILARPLHLEVIPHFNCPISALEFLVTWISFEPNIVPVPAPYLEEDPDMHLCRLHPYIMNALNLSLQCFWEVSSEVSALLGTGGLTLP